MRSSTLTLIWIAGVALAAAGCDDDPPETPADASTESDGDEAECHDEADCDDGIPCTTAYCQGGRCRTTPDDAACDDGLQCTGPERCDPLVGCVSDQPLVCDDHIECTRDQCDTDLDHCVSEPDDSLCGDGYVCDRTAEGCVPE